MGRRSSLRRRRRWPNGREVEATLETRVGNLEDIPLRARQLPPNAIKPEWFAGWREAKLGKAVGLTQFGVNRLQLAPGAYSALRHWHEGEDEFVLVLSGEVTLLDENGAHVLRANDFAGFPAGVANAHHFVNRSSAPAEMLLVGTRRVGEEIVHYPDEAWTGRVMRDARGDQV